MRTAEFDFELPPDRIAQTPAPSRDASRLLVLHRESGRTEHRRFGGILDCFRAGDVLVLNDSRVIPARFRAAQARSGGQVELLLLEENAVNDWWCLLRPGKRARAGTRLVVLDKQGKPSGVQATVADINAEGHRRLQFTGVPDMSAVMESLGEVPLPPYIQRANGGPTDEDRVRYQTVFAETARISGCADRGIAFHRGAPGRDPRARSAGVLCHAARRSGHLCAGEIRNHRGAHPARGAF